MLYVEGLDIFLWPLEKRENKLEKHQNNWIAFCPDGVSDLKVHDSGKDI